MLKKIPKNLEALTSYNQFILYDARWDTNTKKWIKLPIDFKTGSICNAHEPKNWMNRKFAEFYCSLYKIFYIGFVFTENDPFFFIDIDNSYKNGAWTSEAIWLTQQFPGAACEISFSQTGLHIFGTYKNLPEHSCENKQLRTSFYSKKRFAALTGLQITGNASIDFTTELTQILPVYFPRSISDFETTDWTTRPVSEWNGYEDNQKLIEKAVKSKNVAGIFGNKCTFSQLWYADEKALVKAFPHPDGSNPYDRSRADAALAQHLAFWTGKNCDRMLVLMWGSNLKREKWEREDYLPRTIQKSVSIQKTVYTAGPLKQIETDSKKKISEPKLLTSYQYLSGTLQLEYFKGCVYLRDGHCIFTPSGLLLKPEQFNATYGGYTFQFDRNGDKITRKAWEAFTESQIIRWPKVDSRCFRPEIDSGKIIEEEGQSLVNIWVPIKTLRKKGDPELFLSHISKLFPVDSDREIILSYLAACIQHAGTKFHWAPLIQGMEGNGKTLLSRCVAFAVGYRYSFFPLTHEISEKFNDWAFEKLFIGIEDIYVPGNKREIIEILKPLITGDIHAMRAMQKSQVMRDNRANFIINTNHKDGIPKTRTDRRYAVFYTPQQVVEDLEKYSMTSQYFNNLYSWLNTSSGYAIIADFLENYSIPDEYNPATFCQRAPVTSSTEEAIASGLGRAEQEILEAVNEERLGFCGGWISSVAVDRLLKSLNMERVIPPNKRRELLNSIGYDWHPALINGRVNNPIMIDEGKKPRLFIKNRHLSSNLTNSAEVSRAYQKAQTETVGINRDQSHTLIN